jgi:predicted DNA-binding protein (UPF0251 family)
VKRLTKLSKQLTDNKAKAQLAAADLTCHEAEVLALKLFDGFNAEEIASRLHKKPQAIRRLIRLAVHKIKTAGINLPNNKTPKHIPFLQIDDDKWETIAEPKRLPRDLKPVISILSAQSA